ncbi:MAG: Chemotaxis protein methyltransferase CheR [Gemmataceae bacterium]|nr:Chemotaxis protein methyltransferase CheR [Gemmataceae bacterium]
MAPLVSACRSLSVLVVDDYVDAADSLATVLTLCGFPARAVTTTAHALAEATATPPDAVLLDLHLPGMDGSQ